MSESSETDAFRVVDLFCGCGGLTLRFTRAAGGGRFQPVAAVELDSHAAQTYRANFGDHVFTGDIRKWLEGALTHADVVIGGPPCQGFSNLGLRNYSDPRNSLWRTYVTAVQVIRPKVFVLENVPGFLTSMEYRALEIETCPGRGLSNYILEPYLLNAAEYGTPQARKRAIVIGRRRGTKPVGSPKVVAQNFRSRVCDAFQGIPFDVGITNLPDRSSIIDGEDVPGPFFSTQLHVTRKFTPRSLERFKSIPEGGNRYDIPTHLQSPCWIRHKTGARDVMGRLRWGQPSVTIRTEFFKPEKGRYLHPKANRSITHFEAARLQGFPDDFIWYGTKRSIARQIGNAVPRQLASAIAERVLHHLMDGDLNAEDAV